MLLKLWISPVNKLSCAERELCNDYLPKWMNYYLPVILTLVVIVHQLVLPELVMGFHKVFKWEHLCFYATYSSCAI